GARQRDEGDARVPGGEEGPPPQPLRHRHRAAGEGDVPRGVEVRHQRALHAVVGEPVGDRVAELLRPALGGIVKDGLALERGGPVSAQRAKRRSAGRRGRRRGGRRRVAGYMTTPAPTTAATPKGKR